MLSVRKFKVSVGHKELKHNDKHEKGAQCVEAGLDGSGHERSQKPPDQDYDGTEGRSMSRVYTR